MLQAASVFAAPAWPVLLPQAAVAAVSGRVLFLASQALPAFSAPLQLALQPEAAAAVAPLLPWLLLACRYTVVVRSTAPAWLPYTPGLCRLSMK